MNETPKLKIFNRDGTVTEVEPLKLWSPCGHDEGKGCHICDAGEKGADKSGTDDTGQ